ncbi:c-type cytochrome [Thalassomonas sp. RHCl1]|uniref:c-type cytochrome n=1 Tax=Thalassomonas sp. RHCl1 TaxID=2995320 RepID=UPI00248CB457|nr:c-type cytochrome [Thalassomonas sp. RHCl1]
MKKMIFSLLLGLGLVNSASALEGNAEAGKAKSAMCAACHGADGNSPVPIYPNLAGQSGAYIAKQLADFKTGSATGGKQGRNDPVMAGMVAALSEQDMADLGAFFAAQTSAAGKGAANEAGKKLYFGGQAKRKITACVACHGADGKGMASAGFPAVAGQNLDYLKAQLVKFREGTRANDTNSVMRNIAMRLSDDDIAAISEHMASLK